MLTPEQYKEHNDRIYGSMKALYSELFRHYEEAVAKGDEKKAREQRGTLLEVFQNTADDSNRMSCLHYETRFKNGEVK